MTRRHAFVISIFLSLALVAGAFAALRTSRLGARSAALDAAQVAATNRQLDRFEATLRREAQKRPPALPPLPAATARAAATAAPATPATQVIYRRAPAATRVDGHDAEHEHEHDDD
jgi:hypothetical protein